MAGVTDLSAGLHDSISQSFSLLLLIMRDRKKICAMVNLLMNYTSGNTVSKLSYLFFFFLFFIFTFFLFFWQRRVNPLTETLPF